MLRATPILLLFLALASSCAAQMQWVQWGDQRPFISSTGQVVGGGGPAQQTTVWYRPPTEVRNPGRMVIPYSSAQAYYAPHRSYRERREPAPIRSFASPTMAAGGAVPVMAFGVRLDDGHPAYVSTPPCRSRPRRPWAGPPPRREDLNDFDAQVFADR